MIYTEFLSSYHVSIALATLSAGLTIRICILLFATREQRVLRSPRSSSSVPTLIVLGSGGHTAEMMQLTKKLHPSRFQPLHYVLADTDTTSLSKVAIILGSAVPKSRAHRIPRSREVGQSWFSSVASTAYACVWAFILIAQLRPKLVIANGPGTCLPLCLAAFFFRLLGVLDTRVVFCESFCRVKSLSLTGRLLYPIADRFVVQWPELTKRYQRAEYLGVLC